MTFTDLDRVAKRIGSAAFTALSTDAQQRITWAAEAVEQALSLPPWGFRLSEATFTEYLPAGTRIVDEYDLGDYETQANGTIVPLDGLPGASSLQLTHTPVLLSGLVVYEDTAGYAAQGSNPFPASTLLTGGTDYFLDCDQTGLSTSGIIHRIGGTWTRSPRSIKVTYKGGPQAQQAASLGTSFADIYEEVVTACVIHNYAFYEQQRSSFESGLSGKILTREGLGKYSREYSAQTTPGVFNFGGSPVVLPEELLAPLVPFVNLGSLLCR